MALTEEEKKERRKLTQKKWNAANKDYKKNYYEANKEKIKARSRLHHANNREKNNARSREYQAENRDAICQKKKEYVKKNRDKVRKWMADYYIANKSKITKRSKDHYCSNIDAYRKTRAEYRDNNKDKIKEWNKKRTVDLADRYVVQLLFGNTCNIPVKDIHKSLIQAKRAEIKLRRLIKEQ